MDEKFDDPACDTLFAAIGRYSATWAHAEFGLDGILRTIHEGRVMPKPEGEFPHSFKPKLQYFRKAIRLGAPPQHVEACLAICHELSNRAEMRGRIVHGFLVQIEGAGTAGLFGHFSVSKPKETPSTHRYTTNALVKETAHVKRLAGTLIHLSHLLYRLRPDEYDDVTRIDR